MRYEHFSDCALDDNLTTNQNGFLGRGAMQDTIHISMAVGWGELGGGGQSAEAQIIAMKPALVGHDPKGLEQLRWKLMNPISSL